MNIEIFAKGNVLNEHSHVKEILFQEEIMVDSTEFIKSAKCTDCGKEYGNEFESLEDSLNSRGKFCSLCSGKIVFDFGEIFTRNCDKCGMEFTKEFDGSPITLNPMVRKALRSLPVDFIQDLDKVHCSDCDNNEVEINELITIVESLK